MTNETYLDRTTAREIMTPGVVTLSEDALLKHVFAAMRRHGVHAVLIVGRTHGRPLGWVTGRGLLGRLDDDRGLIHARDAITESPVTVEPGATAREVLVALTQAGVSHLIVAEGEELMPEGVLSDVDLVELAAR